MSRIARWLLRLLARYGFLTIQQIVRVSGYSIKTAYKYFPLLKEKGYCKAVTTETAKTEIHYLTPKGARVIADHNEVSLDEVKHLKSDSTVFSSDFYHRIRTVDLLITFHQWIERKEYELVTWDVYFDKVGSQKKDGSLRPKTRVQIGETSFVDPDVIFAYITPKSECIAIVEVARGHETKLALKKIRKTMFAIYQMDHPYITEKYKTEYNSFDITPKFLISFENESLMKSTMRAVSRDVYMKRFNRLNELLFFGLHSQVMNDWESNWHSLDGKLTNPFTT